MALTDKPRVIVESPLRGQLGTPEEYERNRIYARRAMRDSLLRGEAPFASHLLYAQAGILDDGVPEERRTGIDAGLAWASVAKYRVFYVDYGWSEGMQSAADRYMAERLEYFERRIGKNP